MVAIRAVRGARERALHARADARPGAPLHRRGGGGGRRLRGAAQRRLHHEHAPRPRPLPGQGRGARPDVRGAARQGGRLLPGQGRLDAHRRSGRPATSAPTPSSAAARASRPAPRSRPSIAEPARSRSASSARARSARACSTRSMNMALALEAAGHLRLREQPLQRVHALLARRPPARSWRARRGVRHRRRRASTARTCARSTPRRARCVERARARRRPGVPRCARPTATTATTSATSTAPTTGRSEEEQHWRDERDPIDAASATWLRGQGIADAATLDADRRRASQPRWTRRSSSRSTRRIPDPSEVDQDVYA